MKKAAALPILVAVVLLCVALIAEAQQPKRVPRIGFLTGGSPSVFPGRIEAFRKGLRELGYVEGKNIVIEWRYSEGKLDRLPALAAELVRLAVLGSSTQPGNAQTLRETELAAGALGVKLQYFDVLSPKDMEAAFRRAVTGESQSRQTDRPDDPAERAGAGG